MLALPRHVKANGEKSLYFRQGLSRDLHFPQILLASQLFSSISRSKPTAFQAVSFQQVAYLVDQRT